MRFYSENEVAGCITAGFLVGMCIGLAAGAAIARYLA